MIVPDTSDAWPPLVLFRLSVPPTTLTLLGALPEKVASDAARVMVAFLSITTYLVNVALPLTVRLPMLVFLLKLSRPTETSPLMVGLLLLGMVMDAEL